jgi:predicted murein hydrolase (TIGR00659 family)
MEGNEVTTLWTTPLPGLLITVLAYVVFLRVQTSCKGHPLANPVALSIVALALFVGITGIPYPTYFESARFLHFLLGPATVALAIPLARELPRLRALFLPILAGLLCGNLSAILSALWLGRIFGADKQVALSLAPKSVTTPIAMAIAEKIGGLPSLTAVLVITTGVIGAVMGPWLLTKLRIADPATRGIAMGVSSHGLGTARIYQESSEAGAYSGLAMGLSGLLTAIFLPVLLAALGL